MRFGVLGPLTVHDGDVPVTPAAAMLRRLLAALLCRPGHRVPPAELIEILWDSTPPRSARKTLQVYVHRLRQELGSDRVRRDPGGYWLAAEPAELDAARFAELAERARSARHRGELSEATAQFGAALGLWRGPAYADARVGMMINDRAKRLEEQRLLAIEERAEVELDLGRPAELVAELTSLAQAHPYRERPRALLMLALYRGNRQADALEVFRQARTLLAGELGVEPGALMRRLHEAMLNTDGRLATVAAGTLDGTWRQVAPAPGPLAAGAAAPTSTPDPVTLASKDTVAPGTAPPDVAPDTAPLGTLAPGTATPETPAWVSAANLTPAPAGWVPRELPCDVAEFTGRCRELALLDSLLPPPGRSPQRRPRPVIVAITGTAGAGKTALAVHWAHRVAERFPGGQLHVALRGRAPGQPLRPVEALRALLHGLGVPADRLPADAGLAEAMYRTLLARRRVLLLLDDAGDAGQVRPLLPAGEGSLVLITSRDSVGGLVAIDGAQRLCLDALAAGDAATLLARLVGTGRAGAEPAAVTELAAACGHLPLALRIAAARLAAHPQHPIAALAARMRGRGRLAALSIPGDEQACVASAVQASYTRLPPQGRRLLRLLAVAPGEEVTVATAAAIAGVTPDQAGSLLEVLAGEHLLTEHAPDRYSCPVLVREFAAGRGRVRQPPA